jgi:hypothetical protein
MPSGIAVMEWYTSRPVDGAMEDALEQAEVAGFDIANSEENPHAGGDTRYLNVSYSEWEFSFVFALEKNREPGQPLLRIDCGNKIYLSETDDRPAYRDLMDTLFELLCRLAVALDSDYAALFNPESRKAIAHGRPFVDGITELPRMGVYSKEVIGQFGGFDALFDHTPWYTAMLDGDRTVVVDAESGWLEGPWQPPTEASYLTDASFRDSGTAGTGHRDLSDPFESFDSGEIGTDVCVHRDDIASEFANEDLQLIPVRVDEHRNLRHLDTNAFVRNVVTDATGDKSDIVGRMLSDIPATADDDLYVSALLRDVIPPAFVRLDSPDGENVVTKVMRLDTDVSKVKLLVSLGRVAQQDEFTAEDLDSMEGALDTLNELDDDENIDQYIRERLL